VIQPMFPYDQVLCATVATPPKSIAEVLNTFEKIQSICTDGDGLKWFNLADVIDQIPNEKLRTALETLLQQSEGDLEKFRDAVEGWFNDAMDRVSGWYKRHTQWVQLLLGAAFTFALNLDSVLILKDLSEDNSGLLKATVAEAQKFTEHPAIIINSNVSPQTSPKPDSGSAQQTASAGVANTPDPVETLRLLRTEFSALNLPIGWTPRPRVQNKAGATRTAAAKPAAITEANVDGKTRTTPIDDSDFRRWPGWTWQGEKFPEWVSKWCDTIVHHFIGWSLTAIAALSYRAGNVVRILFTASFAAAWKLSWLMLERRRVFDQPLHKSMFFLGSMKSIRRGWFGSVRFTRRTATVTISAPLSSTAALVSAKSRYFPVPTISRDRYFLPPSSNAVSCIFVPSVPLSRRERG